MGAVTLRQIAKEAGVSTTSVSDILQREKGSRYRPETVERVCATAQRMGYQAHAVARMLRQGTTKLIGIAVRTQVLGRESVNPIVVAIENELTSRGYQPVLIDPAQMVPANSQAPFPGPGLIAGIISADLALESEVPEFYQFLAALLPIVALYPLLEAPVDFVTTDRTRAIEMAVEHLVKMGHRRIAFAEILQPDAATSAPKIEGWRRAQIKWNLAPQEGYNLGLQVKGELSTWGQETVASIVALNPRPTAVVCGSDEIALGLIRHANKRGMKLPQELSIVGFNGDEHGEYSYPSLTTLAQPVTEIARVATDRMLELIEWKRAGKTWSPEGHLIEPVLVHRESTAPP